MGTWLENAVNTMLLNYVVTNSDAVIAVFKPVVLTALGIYVFWTGYQVMSGRSSRIPWARCSGAGCGTPSYWGSH